jgi:hypothetical protein
MYRARKVSTLPLPDYITRSDTFKGRPCSSRLEAPLGSLNYSALGPLNHSLCYAVHFHVYTTIPIPSSMPSQTSSGTLPTPLRRCTRTTRHMRDGISAIGGTTSMPFPCHTSPPNAATAPFDSCSWLIASPALVSTLFCSFRLLLLLLPRRSARSSCH